MSKIPRYVRLFGVFVRSCLVKEMEFRGNFWAGAITNIVWVGAYLVFMKIIYSNTKSVGGWNQGQCVMLLGTYALAAGLVAVFFSRNLAELPSQVRLGTFDFTLVKPVNSQFFVSLRYLNFGESGTVLAAILMVFYGASLASIHPTAIGLLYYFITLTCGVAIYYSIYLMLMSTAFWLVKVENLWTLGETAFQITRAPMNIYGVNALKVFTYVIPLVFVAHVPAQALIGQVRVTDVWVGVGMAAVFLYGSSCFWRFATRFYTSASS